MERHSQFAGFVLVGGASSRMGRDKALLPYSGGVLAEFVARQVDAVAGPAVLVGPPERYPSLNRKVLPDLRPGNGPLAGIEAALTATKAKWSLIVACDMPRIAPALLRGMLQQTESTAAECIVPLSPAGEPEPLCCVWKRSCLPAVSLALDEGRRKTQSVFHDLFVEYWKPQGDYWFENLNTPADWMHHHRVVADESAGKTETS